MKKLIQLKKINQNIKFSFYNSKQAIQILIQEINMKFKEICNNSKILLPEIVNKTDKLLIID